MKALTLELHGESIELDELCPLCKGSGDPCTFCAATGFVLTDAGRSVVRFVRRHVLGDGS